MGRRRAQLSHQHLLFERAHDALAEVGFGHQQRPQPVRRNQQRLDIALGMAVDQRDAAGFIKLNALRLRILAERDKKRGKNE